MLRTKRRYQRVDFSDHVRVSIDGKRSRKCRAHDISLKGISITYRGSLPKANKGNVELHFSPPFGLIDDVFDMSCSLPGRIVRKSSSENGREHVLGIEFNKTLKNTSKRIYQERRIKGILAVPLLLLGIVLFKIYNVQYYWYQPLTNIYSLTVSFYILSRFLAAYFYKPPKSSGYYPTVSFVVPVKNDDTIIYKTISHCFEVNYPKEKIEVIVINDGSTDNTMSEILRAKEKYPSLKIIEFEVNKGKRHGMAAGAKIATGEILAFIDSDSIIRPKSLYYLVQGFADPSVGAVCGHANVYNAQESFLTKMQEVRYYVAFRVIKAAEHVFSSVTCCSGSLSAYRREYLMEFLDKWLNQTFMGEPATFGDDRSLTNFMLRNYRVLYDSRAVVETVVPVRMKQFFIQQLRWKKSWFRESFIAGRFMWYKHPFTAAAFYIGIVLPLLSPLIVIMNFIYKPLVFQEMPLHYLLGFFLMSLLFCLYYFLHRPNRKWIYGLYFCVVYMAVLSWQTYYAILTSGKNHWGTR